LSNVWNQIPNWICRKLFSTSLTKSPICVSAGHIFSACNIIINLIVDDRACIDRLHYAKDASASKLKACLSLTRVALLERIQAWALNPTGLRMLLLHGAAGKGKSAIVHTVATALESLRVAEVPFFGFNRSVKDRSLSQLLPTWAK
jgi:hypothetical protein